MMNVIETGLSIFIEKQVLRQAKNECREKETLNCLLK